VNFRSIVTAVAVAATAASLAGASAFAQGRAAGAVRHRPAPSASRWIRAFPKRRLVVFTVEAGYGGANYGQNFDGYFRGNLTVKVPLGWTVRVAFKNVGSLPHSFVLEPWNENPASGSPKPAFPGAETRNPVAGTAPGSGQVIVFKAARAGKFRFVCAYPGHAALGMWDVMVIQKGLRTASAV
jgi:uncharacterized cupredoxin-like copper-binding protein